jgi:hypothetical protein
LNDYLDEARYAADTDGALFRPISNNRTARIYDRRQMRPEDSPTFKVSY